MTYPRGGVSCSAGAVLTFLLKAFCYAKEKLLLLGVAKSFEQKKSKLRLLNMTQPCGGRSGFKFPRFEIFQKPEVQISHVSQLHVPFIHIHQPPQPVSSISGCLTDKDPNVVKIPAIQATPWSKVDEQ